MKLRDEEVRQDADLRQLVWSIAEQIAYLSRLYVLQPGDLLFTGTPAGVGPVKPGDHITGGIVSVDSPHCVSGGGDPGNPCGGQYLRTGQAAGDATHLRSCNRSEVARMNSSGKALFSGVPALSLNQVTEEQAHMARQAYTDSGKGHHRAGLEFGDCFAYALAKATGETLLFKGQDFKRTDISSAI